MRGCCVDSSSDTINTTSQRHFSPLYSSVFECVCSSHPSFFSPPTRKVRYKPSIHHRHHKPTTHVTPRIHTSCSGSSVGRAFCLHRKGREIKPRPEPFIFWHPAAAFACVRAISGKGGPRWASEKFWSRVWSGRGTGSGARSLRSGDPYWRGRCQNKRAVEFLATRLERERER